MKESDIELGICWYLNSLPDSIVWKNAPSGFLFKDRSGTRMRAHSNPFARMKRLDLDWIYKGRLISLEVKKPEEYKFIHKHWDRLKNEQWGSNKRNKHFAEQIRTVERINLNGGLSLFVCSVRQVKELYKTVRIIYDE